MDGLRAELAAKLKAAEAAEAERATQLEEARRQLTYNPSSPSPNPHPNPNPCPHPHQARRQLTVGDKERKALAHEAAEARKAIPNPHPSPNLTRKPEP